MLKKGNKLSGSDKTITVLGVGVFIVVLVLLPVLLLTYFDWKYFLVVGYLNWLLLKLVEISLMNQR